MPRPVVDVIAYIPPDPTRALVRGRHPAEQLAGELGRRWELPVEALLGRPDQRRAARQALLTRDARLTNVRGAFVPRGPANGGVALVDDVYTTGATAAAAATALRKAGATRVEVVTFARTVRS